VTTKHVVSEAELHGILHSYRRFAASYGDRLANHLPMAATALWRMGADEEQIHRFAQSYAKRLELRRELAESKSLEEHLPQLGSRDFKKDSAFFSTQLATSSVGEVLGIWIPRLLPGLSTSAFHCLIRTAYAVESGCKSEIADALAFWSSEYTEFSIPLIEQDVSLQDVIGDVVAHFSDGIEYSGIIVDKMIAVSRESFFAHGLVSPQDLTLDAIRRAVLDLYSQCEDFTLLHTVTSTHAMRVLQRFVGDQQSVCRILWQGILMAVATVSDVFARNQQSMTIASTKADWCEILSRGRDSLDDHVIKLAYTAREESRLGEDEKYRWIAARKVGMTQIVEAQ
jgi:hypothetical protein